MSLKIDITPYDPDKNDPFGEADKVLGLPNQYPPANQHPFDVQTADAILIDTVKFSGGSVLAHISGQEGDIAISLSEHPEAQDTDSIGYQAVTHIVRTLLLSCLEGGDEILVRTGVFSEDALRKMTGIRHVRVRHILSFLSEVLPFPEKYPGIDGLNRVAREILRTDARTCFDMARVIAPKFTAAQKWAYVRPDFLSAGRRR